MQNLFQQLQLHPSPPYHSQPAPSCRVKSRVRGINRRKQCDFGHYPPIQRGQTACDHHSRVPSCKGHHHSLQPVLILGRHLPCFLGEAIFVRCVRCRPFSVSSSFTNAFSAYFSILRTPEPNAPWASKESGSNLIPTALH